MDLESIGGSRARNAKFASKAIFELLILLPFLNIPNIAGYANTAIAALFGGKKDVLYDFAKREETNWRRFNNCIFRQLLAKIRCRTDHKTSQAPTVLIVDDTDIRKTGRKIELVGKVFSHVKNTYTLGYKAMALLWSDGKTSLVADCSIHGEKGRIEGKEQGLTAKQRAKRYTREHPEDSPVSERIKEFFMQKPETLKQMLLRFKKREYTFDYFLCDSWFISHDLVAFVKKTFRRCHFLGMAKLSSTLYDWDGKIQAPR